MGWIQSKIPEVPITNFTNDWNDGRAVGALVDAVAPGTVQKKNKNLNKLTPLNAINSVVRSVPRLERLGSQRRPSKRKRSYGSCRRLAPYPTGELN